MTLYELNQAGYASLPKMTKAELDTAKEDIITFLRSHDSQYYMMLNHDNKYFTLFVYEDGINIEKWHVRLSPSPSLSEKLNQQK